MAEKHMQTAYERAAERPGFQTYQLDTNAFGLYLELEQQNAGSPFVSRFEAISERLDDLSDMLGDGNHRGHALRVLTKVEDFVRARRVSLSTSEATRLTYQIHLLIGKLDTYNIALKVETGSEQTKQSLQRALEALLNPTGAA